MKMTIAAILMSGIAASATLPVLASNDHDDEVPTNAAEITTHLEGLGYVVEELEQEGQLVEAEVTKDGVEMELYLNAEMEIVSTEVEDDDHDDDDDDDDDDECDS